VNVVLCFCGGIKSGKSTLATAVADRLRIKKTSFGDFIRARARAKGIEDRREELQALGEATIAELGWDGFCGSVLETGGWKTGDGIVVDGVRHIAALNALKRLVSPTPVMLVFVNVPEAVRQARADAAGISSPMNLAEADRHSTERDVHGSLRALANIVVDGTQEPDAVADAIVRSLALS
jgi:adenylate kinase family enzyme